MLIDSLQKRRHLWNLVLSFRCINLIDLMHLISKYFKHFTVSGHYLIASGKGAEGSNSKLVSPKFTPLRNSSISIRYAIQGTSILSIGIREYMNGIQVKKSKVISVVFNFQFYFSFGNNFESF